MMGGGSKMGKNIAPRYEIGWFLSLVIYIKPSDKVRIKIGRH